MLPTCLAETCSNIHHLQQNITMILASHPHSNWCGFFTFLSVLVCLLKKLARLIIFFCVYLPLYFFSVNLLLHIHSQVLYYWVVCFVLKKSSTKLAPSNWDEYFPICPLLHIRFGFYVAILSLFSSGIPELRHIFNTPRRYPLVCFPSSFSVAFFCVYSLVHLGFILMWGMR